MMLLTVDWDIQLRQQFKDHTHKAGSGRESKEGCPCQSYRIDARIKEINKLIASGQAMITETIGTDKVLLDAGLL